ncbi:MAG: DUF3575 domain-containing protein [Bacteroidales bacterium]|nr:DUF3575 domain-containing protein [Bacteroidales bacterium]
MQSGRTTANILANIGAKLAMVVLLLLSSAFFVRAHYIVAGEDTRVRVTFPFNNAELRSDYMNNSSGLNSIRQLIDATDGNLNIEIVSYSSPEGNEAYNKALSVRRAASVKNFVLSLVPNSNPTIKVTSVSESWAQFRAFVVADKTLDASSRSELLLIIDSDSSADEKEALIKADSNYKSLYSKYFRSLRYADISLRIANPAAIAVFDRNSVEDGPVVYFAAGSSKIDPNYKDNKAGLYALVAFFRQNPNAANDYVIVGAASPEGPTSTNNRIALMRAKSVADYISERVPEVKGKLRIKCAGEDWNGLRSAIVAEDSLTDEQKQELCAIIDSNDSAEDKEAALKEHPAYETVRDNCFDPLRRQSLAPAEDRSKTSAPVEQVDTTSAPEQVDTTSAPEQVAAPKDTLPRIERLPGIYTKAVKQGEDSVAEYIPVEEPQYETIKEKVPVVAATYNFLPNLATVGTGFHAVPIQGGIEVPVGDHWSIYADYLGTAPWRAWDNNAECAELLHWTLGTRWYPGSKFTTPFNPGGTERILEGWYASLSVGCGYYDFEHNGKGYQGEEILASMGLGYSLVFNENWSMNFGIGFGPMFTQWRYYIEKTSNQHLVYQYSGKSQYFGITDAKITLTYLFHVNKKKDIRK